MANKQTINEALGIHNDWQVLTDARIENLIDEVDTVSEVIMSELLTINQQEFGDIRDHEFSIYEKKLILAGYLLGQAITMRQMWARMLRMLC